MLWRVWWMVTMQLQRRHGLRLSARGRSHHDGERLDQTCRGHSRGGPRPLLGRGPRRSHAGRSRQDPRPLRRSLLLRNQRGTGGYGIIRSCVAANGSRQEILRSVIFWVPQHRSHRWWKPWIVLTPRRESPCTTSRFRWGRTSLADSSSTTRRTAWSTCSTAAPAAGRSGAGQVSATANRESAGTPGPGTPNGRRRRSIVP